MIRKAARWTVDMIVKFFDWLSRFWPKNSKKTAPATAGIGRMVSVLVGLIVLVLGILAFEVIRRSRKARAPVTQESAPISSRDDDPRGANEWERYAARRRALWRCARSAWYHAVLVTPTANVPQFRKDGPTGYPGVLGGIPGGRISSTSRGGFEGSAGYFGSEQRRCTR